MCGWWTMLTKRVKCNACGGIGVIIPKGHGGMVAYLDCKHCNGTGKVEVPITNADHIRSMTDEELAYFLAWHWNKRDYGLEWLKKPYGG